VADSDDRFQDDVRRAIILGAFIREWGLPEYRRVVSFANGPIEVYSFPKCARNDVHRIVTVGLSGLVGPNGDQLSCELELVFPGLLTDEDRRMVFEVMLSLANHPLKTSAPVKPGEVWAMGGGLAVPSHWKTRAFLVDEARGEPESLAAFHLGDQHIDFYWMVGIHEDERKFIESHGIEAFDALCEQSGVTLIDQERSSVVRPPK
jgi:Suppressor of fused protein (SUFU)